MHSDTGKLAIYAGPADDVRACLFLERDPLEAWQVSRAVIAGLEAGTLLEVDRHKEIAERTAIAGGSGKVLERIAEILDAAADCSALDAIAPLALHVSTVNSVLSKELTGRLRGAADRLVNELPRSDHALKGVVTGFLAEVKVKRIVDDQRRDPDSGRPLGSISAEDAADDNPLVVRALRALHPDARETLAIATLTSDARFSSFLLEVLPVGTWQLYLALGLVSEEPRCWTTLGAEVGLAAAQIGGLTSIGLGEDRNRVAFLESFGGDFAFKRTSR